MPTENATHQGKQFELWIFILLLLKSRKEEECEIGKEVEWAGKFDDCVVRYSEKDKKQHIFCQAKFTDNSKGAPENGTNILSKALLMGNSEKYRIKKPSVQNSQSIKPGDFDLCKYFQSYLRIKAKFSGTDDEIKKLIIHTNLMDMEEKIRKETEPKNNIEKIFCGNTDTSKTYVIDIEAAEDIVNYLIETVKTDFDLLVAELKQYVPEENKGQKMPMMKMDNPILKIYGVALVEEKILKLCSEKSCSFHENFILGKNLSTEASEIRTELKLPENKYHNLESWRCCKGFNNFIKQHDQKNSVRLPKNARIEKETLKEDVEEFLNILEFNVGQPDINNLIQEVARVLDYDFILAFNHYNLRMDIEEFVKGWHKEKKEEGWITNEMKQDFFNKLDLKITNILATSISIKRFGNLQSILTNYEISFENYNELNGLKGFIEGTTMDNNLRLYFIQTEETFLTSLKFVQFVSSMDVKSMMFLKEDDASMESGRKVMNLFKVKDIFQIMVFVCDRNINILRIIDFFHEIVKLNKRLILIGSKDVQEKIEHLKKLFVKDKNLTNIKNITNKKELLESNTLWMDGESVSLGEISNGDLSFLSDVTPLELKMLLLNEDLPEEFIKRFKRT